MCFKVRQAIVKEYDQVKEINQTLANFKKDTVHFGGPRRSHEEEPTRDPDVWPPPTPIERDNRYAVKKPLLLCDRSSLDVDNRYAVKLTVSQCDRSNLDRIRML